MRIKRTLSLVIALLMLFSTVSLAAVPRGVVVIGDVAYNLEAIAKSELATEINAKFVANDNQLLFKDFNDKWVNSLGTEVKNPTLPQTITLIKGDGTTEVITIPVEEELKVIDVSAINSTTIKVKFSNGDVENFTVKELTEGENTVEFEYKGQKFTEKVNFAAPVEPVEKAEVEDIKLNNYRNIEVKFNKEVDLVSAADPANYYFEIVEGNLGKFAAKLEEALNLAELNKVLADATSGTTIGGEVEIVAKNDGEKTIVNIYLPESARFVTSKDDTNAISLELYDGSEKVLYKGTKFIFAVHNVKSADKDKPYSIDVATKELTVEDLDKPVFEGGTRFVKVGKDEVEAVELAKEDLSKGKIVEIENSSTVDPAVGSTDKLELIFDEPVFDATATKSTVRVYINNELVAETGKTLMQNDGNTNVTNVFGDVIAFETAAAATYADAKVATLDVKKALANYDEIKGTTGSFDLDKIHNVRVVGVTDLAGNIQEPSTIEFNVKIVESEPEGTDPVVTPEAPVVKDIKQVADNVFYVYFEKPHTGLSFDFVIENADGKDGQVKIKVGDPTAVATIDVPATKEKEAEHYVEVKVSATDDGTTPDVLNYNKQDKIARDVKILEPKVTVDTTDYQGKSKIFYAVNLQKDQLAPTVTNVDIYEADGTKVEEYSQIANDNVIIIDVEDMVPFTPGLENEVMALKYKYDATANEFTNDLDSAAGDYLPIRVSYKDANGATHVAMVSNKTDLKDNPGMANSIAFADGKLTIDITIKDGANFVYADLLDKDGKLVENVTYKIELPKGYFADEKLTEKDNTKVNHVDSGRAATHGFTSTAQTVEVKVPEKVEAGDSDEKYVGVPQTSKEGITYDAVKNQIKVMFIGNVDVDTAEDLDNYTLNGAKLSTYDTDENTIQYVIDNKGTETLTDDDQYVLITVPANSVAATGYVSFVVEGVANPDGGKMTSVETKIDIVENTQPSVLTAKVIGSDEIKIRYDEPVMAKAGATPDAIARNFKVTINGQEYNVLTATVNPSDDTEVTLKIAGTIKAGDTVKLIVDKDQNGNLLIHDKSSNKNTIRVGEELVENLLK